jgi:hypothetical protein
MMNVSSQFDIDQEISVGQMVVDEEELLRVEYL